MTTLLTRRDMVEMLTVAGFAYMASGRGVKAQSLDELYDIPRFGNVSLLHMTDCHAQLLPLYYREPDTNIGLGSALNQPPHLVAQHLLKYANINDSGSRLAHAFTMLDFPLLAKKYGKVGGMAHLKSLIDRLRASRKNAILCDGGDTLQGSGLALWTKGADMVQVVKALGVDLMTGHFEFTYGEERLQQVVEELKPIEFIAQNVKTVDFGDQVFQPYSIKDMNGVKVAFIGQAFPYTAIAHPRRFVEHWSFGIQEDELQKIIDEVKAKGAVVVVLLSHNGMDVDLKLASRVKGLDVILGGHTHDAVPVPVKVGNTIVTNAGSSGKYLGVMDLDVRNGQLTGFQYHLLPIFASLLPADKAMESLITQLRAPYQEKLTKVLAKTDGILYRRGNFIGTGDQLILDSLMQVHDCPIAFSPGFRWGSTLLPDSDITREWVMDMTAITYGASTITEMRGDFIKQVLEDVADNIFNHDPYYQQGGDMVRVGGMTYVINPTESIGKRISQMELQGQPIEADKTYRVAGWAPVADNPNAQKPIWDVVEEYCLHQKTIKSLKPNLPKIIGISNNHGVV